MYIRVIDDYKLVFSFIFSSSHSFSSSFSFSLSAVQGLVRKRAHGQTSADSLIL